MIYNYTFYTTDTSYDYGDFPGGTCFDYEEHGFTVDINIDNEIDMNKFKAYGDFVEMNKKVKSLSDLKKYILNHYEEIEEDNRELFDELISIINEDNLKEVA